MEVVWLLSSCHRGCCCLAPLQVVCVVCASEAVVVVQGLTVCVRLKREQVPLCLHQF